MCSDLLLLLYLENYSENDVSFLVYKARDCPDTLPLISIRSRLSLAMMLEKLRTWVQIPLTSLRAPHPARLFHCIKTLDSQFSPNIITSPLILVSERINVTLLIKKSGLSLINKTIIFSSHSYPQLRCHFKVHDTYNSYPHCRVAYTSQYIQAYQLIDGDTNDCVDTLSTRINKFFVGLTSEFRPLLPHDVTSIAIPDVPDIS